MASFAGRALLTAFTMLYTLISLQACSVEELDQPVTIPVEEQPVPKPGIVNILQSQESDGQALQQAIELYQASNPEVHINVQTVSSRSDYRIKLRSKLLSGEQVDIFHYFSGREARELAPYLEDLSCMDWVSGAADGTIDAVSFDGSIFGIPYALEGYGILVNRNIFEKAGIAIEDILTHEDLAAAFEALDRQIEGGTLSDDFPKLRYATHLPVQDKSYLGGYVADLLLSGQFCSPSEVYEINNINYPNEDAAKSFFEIMLRYGPKSEWEESEGLSWTAQVTAFSEESIGVLLGGSECYRQIVAENPGLEKRIAFLPIPLKDVSTSGIRMGATLYWGVSSASDEVSKNEAKRFLTWLYQSESGAVALASRFGVASPYIEMAKETGLSTHRQMLSYLDRGRALPIVWREFPADWGSGVFAPQFRAWITGDVEWEEMLTRCREGWAYR